MACFLVPAGEAVLTTVAAKILRDREQARPASHRSTTPGLAFSHKLGWLNKMLWGGSALLAFEHLWHGEISPVFPFLTAVQNGETAAMLAEMGTNGVLMAVLVTGVWAGMVAVSSAWEKEPAPALAGEEALR